MKVYILFDCDANDVRTVCAVSDKRKIVERIRDSAADQAAPGHKLAIVTYNTKDYEKFADPLCRCYLFTYDSSMHGQYHYICIDDPAINAEKVSILGAKGDLCKLHYKDPNIYSMCISAVDPEDAEAYFVECLQDVVM